MIGYSVKTGKENTACAAGRNLGISTKHAIEISSMLRGRMVSDAKIILNQVLTMKRAVPFKKFKHKVAHRTGMGPGRYPQKASLEILKVIENAESNAQYKGLNTSSAKIVHINANRASKPMRMGRQGSLETKRTHVEVMIEESKEEKKPKKNSDTKKTHENKKSPKIQKTPDKKEVKKND